MLTSTSPAPSPQTIGTSFRLLRDRHTVVSHPDWDLVHGRHPRTLLASKPDGAVLLIAVDGRWPGHSAGMTLPQAAGLARRLGATDAVNLDGGGSTTFVVRGKVVNRPSDGRERGVVNALAVVADKAQPYDPHYLERLRAERAAKRKARQEAARAARHAMHVKARIARSAKAGRLHARTDPAGAVSPEAQRMVDFALSGASRRQPADRLVVLLATIAAVGAASLMRRRVAAPRSRGRRRGRDGR